MPTGNLKRKSDLPDLTRLRTLGLAQASPGLSPHLLLLLAAVPAFLATRHVLRHPRVPPVAPKIPISVYHTSRVTQPDEPFEHPRPATLAALPLAAAVTASRPS